MAAPGSIGRPADDEVRPGLRARIKVTDQSLNVC
jgi:hypothetical protein